ncbi:hypothetical protein LTR36_003986 [Oleoguttula mirabilis]|uniref:Uncharacterized protein n=1 Tax=Oleoguttula mirabilis TaxID=1507867 RepID=A0AAV9JHD7_9PEZI|nr:hypothetical protein LTR36_003986 [Oleoguttula mirabilis]
MWEAREKEIKVEDQAVARRIRENADEAEVAQTAMSTRQKQIDQYQKERDAIQRAAGQFSVYLKRSSIKPYNDSKLACLDHLIAEEEGKVDAGGSKERRKHLRADRMQHEEEVHTLTEYAKAGANDRLLDQDGISREIHKLYSLELTGPSLQKVAQQLGDLERATYQQGGESAPACQQLVPAPGLPGSNATKKRPRSTSWTQPTSGLARWIKRLRGP